jgi:hypothetical protein
MRSLLLIILSLISLGAIAAKGDTSSTADEALNQNYNKIVTAFHTLNSDFVQSLYDEGACYIPEFHNKQIVHGRDNIMELYRSFFRKIAHKKASIDVDFRVIERKLEGNNATDVGYYLIRFHPAKDTEEPVTEFAGKFVIVAKKAEDSLWYLTVDTNNRAESQFYFDAQPVANLYYGRQFPPLASTNHQ